MSEGTQGSEFPVDSGASIYGGAGPQSAAAPTGSVFSFGWLMAELFDRRRRVSVSARQPPFNPAVQLPQVPDLTPDPQLVFLAAELTELVAWYPDLAAPTARVTAETNKLKAAIAAQDASVGDAAAAAETVVDAVRSAAEAPFSEAALLTAVSELNQAVLDEFADSPEQLSAYQLGLAISDLAWLPYIAEPGKESPASRPSALSGLFSRPQMATVKTLINGAGSQLPESSGSIVSGSLDNWADWLDVHMADITLPGADAWSPRADTVLHALRVQGWIWHSVLTADPDVSVTPSMGAWVQAASSIARATWMLASVILRRFWPLVLVFLALLGGLLYVVTADLSGVSQAWGSLATVVAVVGVGGAGLGGAVSQAFGGVGYEIWAAAKLDASVWSVTWLPALTASAMQRTRLDSRGVAAPHLRKNLDL